MWRPIETAPWDRRVLLWWRPAPHKGYPHSPEVASPLSNNRYAETCVTGSVCGPRLGEDPVGFVPTKWWDGEEKDLWHITHWQPMPLAPWANDAETKTED